MNSMKKSESTTMEVAEDEEEGKDGLKYMHGFGNSFESECVKGALPKHRNNPKIAPLNLYAEQLSGSAFTSPRNSNRRSWMYRIQPSVSGTSSKFTRVAGSFGRNDNNKFEIDPNAMRWDPLQAPDTKDKKIDFIQGCHTMMGCGNVMEKYGLAIHMYSFNQNMFPGTYFTNSDGDFLIVPQLGTLEVITELGRMIVPPQEICVIPRGIVFSVNFNDAAFARGYVLEVYGGHFELPELGPIGSNGLANARDFQIPTAHYCRKEQNTTGTLFNKFGNSLFSRNMKHCPYNVVAWHGNYVPYKYNLQHFCTMNSVSYDHPDPSIYTVLTVPSHTHPGTALADFVIFPPRVLATDNNTFRPPWFHRNVMSEFMGLISGSYDAKAGGGFVPGGASLHNTMTPHGPDTETFHKATNMDCSQPTKFNGGLAFMFETCLTLQLTNFALNCPQRQTNYASCWDDLPPYFSIKNQQHDITSTTEKEHED